MMPAEKKGASIDIGGEIAQNVTIHKNVNQEVIVTTCDKLKLVLIETKSSLTTKRDWITPFGLTCAFIGTLCTADFKQTLGMKPEFWHALFVLLTMGSGALLIKALYRLKDNWQSDDIDEIIERIKPKLTTQEYLDEDPLPEQKRYSFISRTVKPAE